MNTTKIETGSILKSSWGYDQTNIDFFRVVSVSNNWATLEPIGQTVVETLAGYMGEKVAPADVTIGKTFRRKVKHFMGEDMVSVKTYAIATVWNGTPQLQTNTH
jgi:hypothetical protein